SRSPSTATTRAYSRPSEKKASAGTGTRTSWLTRTSVHGGGGDAAARKRRAEGPLARHHRVEAKPADERVRGDLFEERRVRRDRDDGAHARHGSDLQRRVA